MAHRKTQRTTYPVPITSDGTRQRSGRVNSNESSDVTTIRKTLLKQVKSALLKSKTKRGRARVTDNDGDTYMIFSRFQKILEARDPVATSAATATHTFSIGPSSFNDSHIWPHSIAHHELINTFSSPSISPDVKIEVANVIDAICNIDQSGEDVHYHHAFDMVTSAWDETGAALESARSRWGNAEAEAERLRVGMDAAVFQGKVYSELSELREGQEKIASDSVAEVTSLTTSLGPAMIARAFLHDNGRGA